MPETQLLSMVEGCYGNGCLVQVHRVKHVLVNLPSEIIGRIQQHLSIGSKRKFCLVYINSFLNELSMFVFRLDQFIFT